MAIDGAKNAALLAAQIHAVEDTDLAAASWPTARPPKQRSSQKDAQISAEFAQE